jgi:hypothetical protein
VLGYYALRRRRDEWIEIGVMEALEKLARQAYHRAIGLDLLDVAVDCCITKAPCGAEKEGKSPVERAKRGLKHSMAVDAQGIPLGVVAAGVHTTPRLTAFGAHSGGRGGFSIELPEDSSVHLLDRAYDLKVSRERERASGEDRGLVGMIFRARRSGPPTSHKTVGARTNQFLEQRA